MPETACFRRAAAISQRDDAKGTIPKTRFKQEASAAHPGFFRRDVNIALSRSTKIREAFPWCHGERLMIAGGQWIRCSVSERPRTTFRQDAENRRSGIGADRMMTKNSAGIRLTHDARSASALISPMPGRAAEIIMEKPGDPRR